MVFNAVGSGDYWQDILDYPRIYLPTYEGCVNNYKSYLKTMLNLPNITDLEKLTKLSKTIDI